MATIEYIMQILALHLVFLSDYDRQEPSDTYYVKLRNINKIAQPMAIISFNTVARTNNMKSKMVRRFYSVSV